jgi:hypothetical protein
MSFYIREDGTVGGGMPNPLEKQKELDKMKGGGKMSEPNMVMESKEEVIDTIAKKDFDKKSQLQNMCAGCPPSYSFRIKKGDPIQVIKTTKVGTLKTDVFYDLKKHNGQNYAKTIAETPKQPIKDNSNFKGWANSGFNFNSLGIGSYFSEYNIPKDVVEDTSIVEKTKDILSPNSKSTSSLFKIILLGAVAFVIYKVVKKQQ